MLAPPEIVAPVEIPVRAQNQRGRSRAIRSIKAVQHGQRTRRRDHKDRAIIIGAALPGSAVEVTVAGLNESSYDSSAFTVVKVVQRSQHPAGGDFENRSIIPAAAPAIISSAVKVSISALDERRLRG